MIISPFKISPFSLKSSGAPPTPAVIGTLFENPWNAGDYTTVGSASPTFNGNSITLTGGATGNTDYIRYNGWVTSRDHMVNTIRFTVDVFNGTSYGMGLIIKSINSSSGADFSFEVYGVTSNNSENGKLYVYSTNIAGNWGFIGASSAMAELPSLNDEMELIVTQGDCSYTIEFYNLTKDPTRSGGTTYTYTYSLAYPFNSFIYHNTAKLGLAAFGGTHTITYWNCSTAEYKYSDLLVVGDSKTIGFGCSSVNNRYGYLIETNNPGKYVTTNGGGSDKTNEFLASLDELKNYQANKAILCIGRNDIDNSIPSGTWQSNYQAIVAGLESVGTEVWHQLPLPETVLDQSALTNWITATYPTKLISVPGTWNAATDNVADGIHPNDTGHNKIYTNIMNTITL